MCFGVCQLGEGIMINWGVDLPYDSGEVGPRARSDLPRHLGSPLTFVWWASPRAHLLTLTREIRFRATIITRGPWALPHAGVAARGPAC